MRMKTIKPIISIVGAGGKTTLAHQLASQLAESGQRVLLTTSTHMYVEADTDISCNAGEILEKIKKTGYCMAGELSADPCKIQCLPETVFCELKKSADIDVIIAEADGARQHSAKYPRSGEPVIYPDTVRTYIVMGMAAVGKNPEEEIFGYEALICSGERAGFEETLHRSKTGERTVTEDTLRYLMRAGYRERLLGINPQMELVYMLSEWRNKELYFEEWQE